MTTLCKDDIRQGHTTIHKSPVDPASIIDHEVAMLITAGTALAVNCKTSLSQAVQDLLRAGVGRSEIRAALKTAQYVKDKPAARMKETADILAGTSFVEETAPGACPAEKVTQGRDFKITMLAAAGAAMGANCEPCLDKIAPVLVEAGVAAADIRRALEIAQKVKDRAAASVRDAAEILTDPPQAGETGPGDCPKGGSKQRAGCCA